MSDVAPNRYDGLGQCLTKTERFSIYCNNACTTYDV